MSNFYKVFVITFAFLLTMWATLKINNRLGEIEVAILKQTVSQEELKNLELRKMILAVCKGAGTWNAQTEMIECK